MDYAKKSTIILLFAFTIKTNRILMYSYTILSLWIDQWFGTKLRIVTFMMYKFGLVCFVLAASVVVRNDAAQLTESQKSKIYGLLVGGAMDCMRDFPLSLDHIKDFRNKKIPNDEVAKCFSHCLYKKLGLLDDSGKLSEKKSKAAAKKIFKDGDEMLANIEQLFSKCIHVNDAETSDGDKGCDRAKLISECFIEHATELGLDMEF